MNTITNRLYSERDLMKLCLPLFIEQTLTILVGMVDVLMVASLGETAVSGVSLVDTVNILMIQVLAGIAAGGAVVCSQFFGAGKPDHANRAASQLLTLTVLTTILITSLCVTFSRPFLGLLFGSVEPAVMNNAVLYFRLTALSYPFLALYNSAAALFRVMGDSKTSMRNSMIMNLVNIVGNALCIYVLHMGVEGVAIPTLISRALVAVIMINALRTRGGMIRITSAKEFVPNKELILKILSIGVPTGLENGMFHLGKVMLSGIVSTLGTTSIAGFAVAGNLVTFLYLPGNSLGLALLTVSGRCVGAGDYEQAKFYTKKFMLMDYIALAVIASLLGFGRHFFVGLYSLEGEAAEIAAHMLLSHCLAMILWPPSFLLPNTLRAANLVRYTMVVSMSVMWIFRVGLAYVFVILCGFNVYYVWYAMFIDWIVRFVIYLRKFKYLGRDARERKQL